MIPDKPLISIVIPSYNHERYIQGCINSVIKQDYENIELIIIDDGSSDKSVEKIREMVSACEKRFVRFCFRTRHNIGLSATLNEATEWCRGSYYSAIASDDVLLPNKTSALLRYLEEDKDLAGVFCGYYVIDSNGKVIDKIQPREEFYSFDDIATWRSNILAPTQLLRLENVRRVGGYPDNLYIEDWYMWLALAEKGYRLRVVEALLVGYRQHEGNCSSNAHKMYLGRVRVLDYFSKTTQYNKSMAITCLFAAIDYTSISKIRAIKFVFEGAYYSKRIILSALFANCILRLIIPRFLFVQAKEWRRTLNGAADGDREIPAFRA